MKNIIRLILSIVISLAVAISLLYINSNLEIDNSKHFETFTGYISETVYENIENAAKGYLDKELSGEMAGIRYNSCRKIKSLSQQEIDTLNLKELTEKSVTGVDNVEIYYVRDDIKLSIKTLFVSTDSGYMYFVTPQQPGEPLTNSYLNSVLSPKNYSNCTCNTSLNFRIVAPEITLSSAYYQSIFIDYDKMHLKHNIPGLSNEIYLIEKDNKIIVYTKDPDLKDDKFYTLSEINKKSHNQYKVTITKGGNRIDVNTLSSIEQAVSLIFLFEFDASYFVKQDFGYSLSNNKFKDLCKSIAGESYSDIIDKGWSDYQVNFRGNYYVDDGKLSSCDIVLTMINDEKIFALNISTKYSNFGTTSIELPFDTEVL